MEVTKRIIDNHVLHCQSSLIDYLLSCELLLENTVCLDNEDILEWWLVTPWLARRLQDNGETVIGQYDCNWWGRTCSGQAIYMDAVMVAICEWLE